MLSLLLLGLLARAACTPWLTPPRFEFTDVRALPTPLFIGCGGTGVVYLEKTADGELLACKHQHKMANHVNDLDAFALYRDVSRDATGFFRLPA